MVDGGADDGTGAGIDGGDLVGDLARWLAEQRVDAAAASRARERWLRLQLDEEATLAGILLDMAESDLELVVVATTGRRHHGIVRAVAEDFCALRTTSGRDVLVAFASIASVQARGASSISAGSRPAALDLSLGEALSALVADRPRVLLVAVDGSALAGELRSVGRDVLVIRPDGEGTATYLPIGSLAEVTIAP